MNSKRKTFVINSDWYTFIENLDRDEEHDLIRAIFAYASNDEDISEELNDKTMVAWGFIKQQLKDYRDEYEKVCQKRSENGKKGGRGNKKTAETDTVDANSDDEKADESKKSKCFFEKQMQHDSDNDNDSDSDNDNDNDSDSDSDSDNESVCDNKKIHTHTQNKEAFGKYKNVFLTKDEYSAFKSQYSFADEVIEELSSAAMAYPDKYSGNSAALLDRFIAQYKIKRQSKQIREKYGKSPPQYSVKEISQLNPPSYDINAALERSRKLTPNDTKKRSTSASV